MSSSQITVTKSCASNGKSPGCVRGFVRERCCKCYRGSIACEMCLPRPSTPTTPALPLTSSMTASSLSVPGGSESASSITTAPFHLSSTWKRPRKAVSFSPRRSQTFESSSSAAVAGLPSPPRSPSLSPPESASQISSSAAAASSPKRPSPSSPTTISFALNNNSHHDASAPVSASPPASPTLGAFPEEEGAPAALHDTHMPSLSTLTSSPSVQQQQRHPQEQSSSSSLLPPSPPPTASSSVFPPTTPTSSCCMFCRGGRKACEECFGLGYVQRVCQDCLRETHHRSKRQRRASSTGRSRSSDRLTTTDGTLAGSHAATRRKSSLPVLNSLSLNQVGEGWVRFKESSLSQVGNQLGTWNQMGVQMGVQMTKFKEQSKNQMEGGWSKFKEQVIVPLATVARVGGGSGTPPPPSSALSEAVAAEAEAEVVVESEEDLPASYQEPISEKALEDPTAMTITPTMDIIEAHEQEDDVVGPEGDRIKNKTSSEIRESSEDSAAARNLVSSPLPSPSPSPSSPTDQQIHQDGGSKGNNNNVRLSFKATVKKHLKVRPLFTICSNKSDEQEDNGSSTSNNNNSNTNNNNSSASRDPTDTIKDTRNKRRRRHWSFPALLSPSLLRTVSSAA